MCGIAGMLRTGGGGVSPALLQRMTDIIKHRGPDGEGHWIEGPVGLGHRRLSIIDLSPAGQQPMMSADQRFVMTYNGEVYNFRELRAELEAEGHQFRSRTDTEVILTAFAAWGAERAVSRLNGMFALAIWDRRERRLILARDRYGIKPLYYMRQGGTFAFASEQKAILQLPEFKVSLNRPALFEYFTFQNLFTDQTLVDGMRLLPAGCWAEVRSDDPHAEARIHRYWDFDFHSDDANADQREYEEELDRLFSQAVNRQLVSDVELGSFLSGGMDSGSITAVAAASYPYMKTFTCGFDMSSASGMELAFDERARAEAMSYHFKTEHYEMVLKAGDMERVLPQLAWHLEEPRVGQSYPNFYASKLAGKFVKVVLSGAGGDELFGGYPWRYYKSAGEADFDAYADQYYAFWQRMLSDDERQALFRPIWNDVADVSTRDIFRSVFRNTDSAGSPEANINHSLYFEAKTFLHGILVVEDKLSMAHSLETRVPFLDNDLVDFAMRCPVRFKLRNSNNDFRVDENMPGDKQGLHYARTSDGKIILRDVMARHIPAETAKAAKQGFSAPDASWFKGESIDFVRRRLYERDSPLFEVLDAGKVRALVDDHLSGRMNRRLLVWSLLNMDHYLEQLGA